MSAGFHSVLRSRPLHPPLLTIFYPKKPKHFFQQFLRHHGASRGLDDPIAVVHPPAHGRDTFLTMKSLGPVTPQLPAWPPGFRPLSKALKTPGNKAESMTGYPTPVRPPLPP